MLEGDKWAADRLELDNMMVGDIEDTGHRTRMVGKVGNSLLAIIILIFAVCNSKNE